MVFRDDLEKITTHSPPVRASVNINKDALTALVEFDQFANADDMRPGNSLERDIKHAAIDIVSCRKNFLRGILGAGTISGGNLGSTLNDP